MADAMLLRMERSMRRLRERDASSSEEEEEEEEATAPAPDRAAAPIPAPERPLTPPREPTADEKVAALISDLRAGKLGPARFNSEFEEAWELKTGNPIPKQRVSNAYMYEREGTRGAPGSVRHLHAASAARTRTRRRSRESVESALTVDFSRGSPALPMWQGED